MSDDMIRDDRAPEALADASEEADGGIIPAAVATQEVAPHRDKELEVYRSLLTAPTEFKNGFTWTVVAGAFFCGLLMMPGSIYLSLITGGTISAAWVTLIIFSEVSRRALKSLCKQELVVLLSVAGAMSLGGPIAELIFRQYFITSDAVRDVGLMGGFPEWWAPVPGDPSLAERSLFSQAWLWPILLMVLAMLIGRIKSYTLGYFFFRLTSDVERLPFPFAPISAQGAMALAESGDRKTSWKWNVFSIGAIIGLAFAVIQIGVPLVSGAILAKPIQIIPLPWLDTSTLTEGFMPATPTGAVIDLGLLLSGMVMPFWAVMGTMSAILLTFVLNPILYHFDILSQWQPGMNTINTQYMNWVDFWMSFTIGVMAALAIISIYQSVRDLSKQLIEARRKQRAGESDIARRENIWTVPGGRGDFALWLAPVIYVCAALVLLMVCHILVPAFPIWIMCIFMFIYTPFISYLNARLIGINGVQVDIPMLREGVFILSGFKGVDIWLAPIPMDNYGAMAGNFRVNELTGTNFFSYIKADLLVIPLSFMLSLAFWAFVWHSSPIPSESFPWAQQMWDLRAKQTILTWSATLPSEGGVSPFFQALHPPVIGGAFTFTMVAFMVLTAFNLPTMAIYGFIMGVGQLPHSLIFIVFGAFLGKFYFQKRFGQTQWLQMAPVLMAGYSCGVGLIALAGVAVTLITKAISPLPF